MEQGSLVPLLHRGGVFYNIPGETSTEALVAFVDSLTLPQSLPAELLKTAILERENLMPTAVGHGIALPHPRTPLLSRPEEEFIAMGYLQRALDWHALDGKPVRTLILIGSATPKSHLWILSRLSFLCQQEPFRKHLEERASIQELTNLLQKIEQTWK
ncbi:MAG TPA: PTS sugar transporter subunit IIA [Termitinemataceae bacterium]|uniref:PTS sugar transporter subunit IIA n=1 Tax=Treponema sp. J25 TaxID=2094121 RepID=UPI0010502436|nr:PTS sugar transporter subunit IIA [Treponema sp. J25]TCW60698.1 PTS sugar transporter subunit IIA [Treponema sp. J25]HOJ99169.1 PTS sugar transporter subunit IIA [Termitinemataceae bacterium]HOM23194.1 PTS sugar transporter subunit IIA [Termitinemataceae bacterium]HPQ00380.1 PTS sugar transporter subunit IIA [Termitinemataceae bacterium]